VIAKAVLATGTVKRGRSGYYAMHGLYVCDGGRYLVAYVPPNGLYVTDAQTLAVHAHLDLSELNGPQTANAEGQQAREQAELPDGRLTIDCAGASPLAVVASGGDLNIHAIKVIDLEKSQSEKAVEVTDLAGVASGVYQNDGVAISPDGSRLGVVTYRFDGNGGKLLTVMDVRSRRTIRSVALGQGLKVSYDLAFAGNDALVVGERRCEANGSCDVKLKPSGRKLRVWDFAGGAELRPLGDFGAETYASFGAAVDGSAIFSYSGMERYCGWCSEFEGEMRVTDARFTVWDARTGRVVARSPKLRVEEHDCPWFHFSSCGSYDQPPELRMSGDGRSFVGLWPHGQYPMVTPGSGVGSVEVYRRQ
jgi:hypothetical protein